MKEDLVIIGAGGHGREAVDVARETGKFNVIGFVSDAKPDTWVTDMYDIPWLGKVKYLSDKAFKYVIAIGDCTDKKRVRASLAGTKSKAINLIHPSAYIGSNLLIGSGVMIYAGARLTTHVTLGNHVHVNINSTISHDCAVGDYSIIGPGASLNGNVHIGNDVFVGTGAIILPKVRVGNGAMIGAGAVVTKDVPAYLTYAGVPARKMKT